MSGQYICYALNIIYMSMQKHNSLWKGIKECHYGPKYEWVHPRTWDFACAKSHVPMLYQFPAVLYSQKEKNINHGILHRIGGSQKSGKISDIQMAASDFWLSENGDFCTVQRLYLMLTKSLVTNSKDGKQFLEGWVKALSDLTQNLQHFFFSTWLKFYSFN